MRARRWAVVGAVAMVMVTASVPTAGRAGAVAGFRDVPPDAFFTPAVQWARDVGVTVGMAASDRFEPGRRVTRAETVTMLWRLHGSPPIHAPRFADQPPGAYYDQATQWARATGTTTGVAGTDRFEPDRFLTRAELVTLLYRSSGSPPVRIDRNPPYQPDPLVYLTFDDGPDPRWTPLVLDALDRHDAVATFFVVGRSARTWPDLVRQAASAGHAIENHTMTHPRLSGLSSAGIAAELSETDRIVRDITGRGTSCFRPPYGATNNHVVAVAAGLGLPQVLWTLDTSDYKRPGAGVLAARVLDGVRPGSNILFHDGGGDRSQTVAALDVILPELHRRGYRTALICS